MRLQRSLGAVAGGLCVAALCGCPSDAPAPDPQSSTELAATREPGEPRTAGSSPEGVDAQEASGELGRVVGGPLPLEAMLGKTPQQVESFLGEPLGKGMMRESCVRFVPDKVWFRCNYAWQRYQDETGNLSAVQVSYEDGKATAVAMEGIRGEGPFDPMEALRKVGLELPGEPRASQPTADTKLWSWFNSEARLLIGGRQHRVEVSAVGGQWHSSKVEIMLNDPLSPEERQRILEHGREAPPEK